jgi:hypothetical protein
MVAFCKRADNLSPAPRLAPDRLRDERQVGHVLLPSRTALQSALTKCRLLHTTLIKIEANCDRASRCISMAIAEADFEK